MDNLKLTLKEEFEYIKELGWTYKVAFITAPTAVILLIMCWILVYIDVPDFVSGPIAIGWLIMGVVSYVLVGFLTWLRVSWAIMKWPFSQGAISGVVLLVLAPGIIFILLGMIGGLHALFSAIPVVPLLVAYGRKRCELLESRLDEE